MCVRSCRIAVTVITLIAMVAAIALIAAALATPSWQIADLSTYPQIRRIYSLGLINNCIHYVQSTNQFASNQFPSNQLGSNQFGSNQFPSNQFSSNQFGSNQFPSNQFGSNQFGTPNDFHNFNPNQADLVFLGPPLQGQGASWQGQGQGGSTQFQNTQANSERCARIPYNKYYYGITHRPQEVSQTVMNQVQQTQVQNMRWFTMNDLLDPATSHGFLPNGEDWRLATLILLAVACGFTLFALIAEITASCLDCFKLNFCLRAASGASLVLIIVALLSGLAGIVLFACYTGPNEEIYIFEQNAIGRFQWGGSFWLGVGGVGIAGVAFLLDIMHLLLVRGATKKQSPRYKQRLPKQRSIEEMYDRLPVVIESDGRGTEVRKKDWSTAF